MPRFSSLSLVIATAVASLIASRAEETSIWSEAGWTLQAPQGGCSSMPLLQVKGAGSIFDAPNASVLANLEKALPAAMAKACPGTREVILVSGRSRRLVRLAPVADAPPPPPPAMPVRRPVAAPTQDTPTEPAHPSRAPLPPPERVERSAGAVPMLGQRTTLHSLGSAHSAEEKCEVLYAWLESGKAQAPVGRASYAYRPPAQMMTVFRDDAMTAVFGTTYDNTENRWRLEQHEKVISPCLGLNPQRPNPWPRPGPWTRPSGPNRTMQQYAQEFQQYRQLLDQAFLGQPGPFEPTAIVRHVQEARAQVAWANETMSLAAAAQPTRESFDAIAQRKQSASARMSLLGPDAVAQVARYLGQRQSELAPSIADAWFRDEAAAGKGAASAKVVQGGYSRLAPVLQSLEPSARTAFEAKYQGLIDSLIAEPLQAEVARLQSIPASLPGVLQLSAWRGTFDATFRDLRAIASVQAAEFEYNHARARIIGAALPTWIRDVQAIPADGAAITAKRHELETMFPSRDDRSSAAFAQYEMPLRAKEDELRSHVEAEMRKRQEQANTASMEPQRVDNRDAASRSGASAPVSRPAAGANLTAGSFSVAGLQNDTTLMSLYKGDFDSVGLHSDDMIVADAYSKYLRSYGSQCDKYLPKNKVEITEQVCTARWVNGYGADRGCATWETRGTGIYADPALYGVAKRLDAQSAMDAPRNALKMMSQKDPIAGMMGMAGNVVSFNTDVEALVAQNGCASAGLKRFEENFTRFATNKPPIRLGDAGPKLSAIDPLPGIPFRDQNYSRLMEDLVRDQAKTWAINRYVPGSVAGVTVTSRDGEGRPAKIVARYSYSGFSGRSNGSVTLTFSEGSPSCMYFFDFPATCRTPDRRIASAYSEGAYKQE